MLCACPLLAPWLPASQPALGRRRSRTLGAVAFRQHGGRLVVRVLRRLLAASTGASYERVRKARRPISPGSNSDADVGSGTAVIVKFAANENLLSPPSSQGKRRGKRNGMATNVTVCRQRYSQ